MDHTKYKVLFIEDDELDCKAFERFVNDQKLLYDYSEARSISEAKEILKSRQFDIIVSDYSLSDGTALDILNSVKDIPIILITGVADEQVAINAWKAGAYDYLPKDIDQNYLKAIPKAIENAIKRKKTEDALDRKKEDLEAIFDAVPVGMLLIDENMIVVRVNYTIKEMLHKEYVRIINQPIGLALGCANSTYSDKGCGFGPACAECLLKKAMSSVLDSGQSIQEIRIHPTLQVNNQQIKPWFCISVKLVMISDRKYLVVAIDNITQHMRAEEKLKETMELKSQFISTVSHELRTPLAAMKEGVAIVLDGVLGQINEDQRKFLVIAKRNADRLGLLINDVLDFQKMEAGRIKPNIMNNDIEQVVSEVHSTMVLVAEKNKIELMSDCAEGLHQAEFDRSQIIQVLTNLVSNAIKFTPECGRVYVNIYQQNDELVINVSDTGMGIPKDDLPKIFERFYRVNRRGKEIQGTGLGLAIVHKIVMMHGGRIDVESEIDKGTTFTVYLPMKSESLPQDSDVEMDKIIEESIAESL